jgi:hypothetical protein
VDPESTSFPLIDELLSPFAQGTITEYHLQVIGGENSRNFLRSDEFLFLRLLHYFPPMGKFLRNIYRLLN